MTTEEQIQRISTKSGVPLTEVQAAYNTALNSLPMNIPASKREQRALVAVNADLTGGGKSPAIGFDIVIIGIDPEARDLNSKKTAAAIEAFNNNPDQAQADGLVKVEGETVTPLDTLKTFKNGNTNNNFGKPLKPSWIKNAIVACKKPSDANYVSARLQLRDTHSKADIPLNQLISTRLLGDPENGLRSSASASNFAVKRTLTQDELTLITDQAFESHMKSLKESFEYVKDIKGKEGFYDRFVVTEGSVTVIKKATDPSKNHFLMINDISTDNPVGCFVPFNLGGLLNIGRKSQITLIAQPNIGKGWNRETKTTTDEDVLQLNVLGLQHVPGMIKPLEEDSS